MPNPHWWLRLCTAALVVAGCGGGAPVGPAVPLAVRLVAGEGGERLHHERTGPTWTDEHVAVGDAVWWLGEGAAVGAGGVIEGVVRNEVAAFVAGSPVRVEIDLAAEVAGTLGVVATGWLEHVPESVVELGRLEALLGPPSVSVSLPTSPLPDEVGVFVLDLAYAVDGGEALHTRHRLPLAWARPIDGTPLYEQTVTWASTWAAGLPSRRALPTEQHTAIEDEIARRLLRGVWSLGEQGYSYGRVKRPDGRDNQAHVLLDFKRAACGEYRGLLLSLLEYHGIDARWLMMSFRKPSTGRLSMYETRSLPAVGTEPQVWRHWNHVVVELNGQIYDPTYGLQAASFEQYEDDLFARYCFGEDEKCRPGGWCQQPRPEGSCVDNPPGFDPSDPINGMKVWRGDDY